MFGKSNLWRLSHRTYDIGDEDPLIKEISKALARLSLSGQTEAESSRLANNGGSNKIKEAKGTGPSRAIEGDFVQQTLSWRIPLEARDKTSKPKQTLREGLEANPPPSPKRSWEDLESTSIRRPDSLGPERKRRVDKMAIKKSSWVSICCARAFQRKSVNAFQSRAIKETSVRVQQTLPPEPQKKMATPKMSPSPTTYLKSPNENYNRTDQTQKEGLKDKGKPSYKRKWEDFNSAGIRRPDNLGPQRKRRRVVLKRVRADGDIVMIKKRNRRRNRRCHLKPVQGAEEWRDPECSGHKGLGEKTWRGGSKKAKHDVRSCFDEKGNTGPKNPSTPVYRSRPFPKKERYRPQDRRNPQSMRHQGRRQWETPGLMCRTPVQRRAQKVPHQKPQ